MGQAIWTFHAVEFPFLFVLGPALYLVVHASQGGTGGPFLPGPPSPSSVHVCT